VNRLVRIVVRRASDNVILSQTTFVYDGLGRRKVVVEQNVVSGAYLNTRRVSLVYDGMDVVRESEENWGTAGDTATKTTTTYQLTRTGNIGGILARTKQVSGQSDRHSFYSYDGTGNVTTISDASQNVQCAYSYSGFGLEKVQEASGWGQPYRYSTKWQHPNSGLVDYGFRFYNPSWGRWINRDPIGEAGGSNLYAMVGNNPINYGDTNGLWGVQFGSGPNIGLGDPSLIVDQDAVNRGGLGAQAAVDGFIPFWDPFSNAGGYNPCDNDLQFSWKAGAFARDVYFSRFIPNFSTWAKSPVMYEVGQKTLTNSNFAKYGALSTIERGQAIIRDMGWLRGGLVSEGSGWRLGIGTTFKTGPTPGAWLLVGALTQAGEKYLWNKKNDCGCK